MKVPSFFTYAKDKHKRNVAGCNNSTMNRISKKIVNSRLDFDFAKIKRIDYKMLMKASERVISEEAKAEVIKIYEYCNKTKRFRLNRRKNKEDNIRHTINEIKKEIIGNRHEEFVVDILVKYLYEKENRNMKTLFWDCFGNVVVQNIEENLKKIYGDVELTYCEECGERIAKESNRTKYCKECLRKKQLEWQRRSMKKLRDDSSCEVIEK